MDRLGLEMMARCLIEPARLQGYFGEIEPELFRFPAIDPATFRRAVAAMLTEE